MSSFSERLRESRKSGGLTQAQAAEIGGVTPKTQGAYERGESQPDTSYLEKLGKTLDVAYILTGEEATEKKKDPVAFDPDVGQQAVEITEKLIEVFVIPRENLRKVVPVVYSFLMMGNFGTTEQDMINVWADRLCWPKRK